MFIWDIRKGIATLFLAGLLGFGPTVPRLAAADALQYTLQDVSKPVGYCQFLGDLVWAVYP
jgi:hypothetical protein